jgi:glycerol-3-phosphate dehydrogenase (NAD(P)+)
MRVGVLGAGSWGTALAIHAASTGAAVQLWARREELAEQLIAERCNSIYLPGVEFPDNVTPTADVAALAGSKVVFVVVPSHGYREVTSLFLQQVAADEPPVLISATKGIETESLARMSQVTAEEAAAANCSVHFAVLSGPTFAAELAAGCPSAAVLASSHEEQAARLVEQLSTDKFRLYSSTDVVGVELAGTAKNVIAIGAGIVSGLGLGHNTLAALITRGLHEIRRLGVRAIEEPAHRHGAGRGKIAGGDSGGDVNGGRRCAQFAIDNPSGGARRSRDADFRADDGTHLRGQVAARYDSRADDARAQIRARPLTWDRLE